MVHSYDRYGIRFAAWVGHGRDPELAYLDARQLVITSSELGTAASVLYETGATYSVLGGVRHGDVVAAVLHRLAHTVVDAVGAPRYSLQAAAPCTPLDGLCDTARQEPRPGTPADPEGRLVIEAAFALQWVTWADMPRAGTLRRAVYLDDRILMEAGTGPDGGVRIWPARGLMAAGLELVTPTAQQAALIEERIERATSPAVRPPTSDPVH